MLEVGGAPQDLANLWPESWTGDANAHMKDAAENFLNREVCRGTIPLAEAQRQIATDWLSVYKARGSCAGSVNLAAMRARIIERLAVVVEGLPAGVV